MKLYANNAQNIIAIGKLMIYFFYHLNVSEIIGGMKNRTPVV